MSAILDVAPAVTVTAGKGRSCQTAYYEAVWHEPQESGPSKSAKQRIGKAWLDFVGRDDDGRPQWAKRRGRVPKGYFDERRAIAAAADAVKQYRERRKAKRSARTPTRAETITVRELAHEMLEWLREEKGAAPSTLEGYEYMLREPGIKAKRGSRKSHGRIMRRFGDRPAIEVEAQEAREWLKELGAEGLKPRNINAHRSLLHAVFAYGQRSDTYKFSENPVTPTTKRREPPLKRVDYYEAPEVEALAVAAASGAHRKPRGRKHPRHRGPVSPSPLSHRQRLRQEDEQRLRVEEDHRDAELLRVLFGSGLRLGEVRALRIENVMFAPDMSGVMLHVKNAFSANQEKPPKSWQPRDVVAPRSVADALARVLARRQFTAPRDFVFCGREGKSLSGSAIRKRYKAACKKAGLREVPLHGLRHAAGSILATRANQVFAKETLGHHHVSTTDRYTHGKIDWRSIEIVNTAFADWNAITAKRAEDDDSQSDPLQLALREVGLTVTSVPPQMILGAQGTPRIRADLAPLRPAGLLRTGSMTLACVSSKRISREVDPEAT